MKILNLFVFFLLLIIGYHCNAQEVDTLEIQLEQMEFGELDTVSISSDNKCNTKVPKNRINKKKFAQTPPQYITVDNQKSSYVGFRLLKYKNKILLYTKIFDKEDVCIRADRNFEILFTNTKTLTLENKAMADCKGDHVIEFTSDELGMIKDYLVEKIEIFSFDRNYEVLLDKYQYRVFLKNLKCLEEFKIPRR